MPVCRMGDGMFVSTPFRTQSGIDAWEHWEDWPIRVPEVRLLPLELVIFVVIRLFYKPDEGLSVSYRV